MMQNIFKNFLETSSAYCTLEWKVKFYVLSPVCFVYTEVLSSIILFWTYCILVHIFRRLNQFGEALSSVGGEISVSWHWNLTYVGHCAG